MQPIAGLTGNVPMGTAEPYRHAKTKENTTQQAKEAISIFKLQSKMGLGRIILLKYRFSFSSDCFLSTKLRKFFSQSLQLGQQKETKNSLVQQCLEMKSDPQKNLNRGRQEIRGYKSFLNAGTSLSSSLHGVAHPSVQKKIIYSGYKLLRRRYMERQLGAEVTGCFFSASLCNPNNSHDSFKMLSHRA